MISRTASYWRDRLAPVALLEVGTDQHPVGALPERLPGYGDKAGLHRLSEAALVGQLLAQLL